VIFHTRQENNGPFRGGSSASEIPPAPEYFRQEEEEKTYAIKQPFSPSQRENTIQPVRWNKILKNDRE
jgi:hypothetical protein